MLLLSRGCRQCGVSAKVIMPKTADPIRIDGCNEMGAEVILTDNITTASKNLHEIAKAEGRTILHPFNDLNMAYGAASCGAEFVEDMPDAVLFIIPVGGGGLIAGMAAAIKHFNPKIKIIGVEPKGANSLRRSLLSGSKPKQSSNNCGLVAFSALAESFAARANVDQLIEIDDKVMIQTMRRCVTG